MVYYLICFFFAFLDREVEADIAAVLQVYLPQGYLGHHAHQGKVPCHPAHPQEMRVDHSVHLIEVSYFLIPNKLPLSSLLY